jgi:hypothetical protein
MVIWLLTPRGSVSLNDWNAGRSPEISSGWALLISPSVGTSNAVRVSIGGRINVVGSNRVSMGRYPNPAGGCLQKVDAELCALAVI